MPVDKTTVPATAVAHDLGDHINASLSPGAEPLQYWYLQFAEWLVSLPTQKPAQALQVLSASQFAGREVTWAEIRTVRRRNQFKDYMRAVASMPMTAARMK